MKYTLVMATIKNIAEEAGVSLTTVSNVIHGRSSRVSPETVAKINKIIEEQNYRPNMTARALVNKSSKIIGVINHTIKNADGVFTQDPFHGAVIGGIERELGNRGYVMMMRTVENEEDLLAVFRQWTLDGLIITGVFEDSFFNQLVKSKIPFVLLDSYINNKNIFNVGIDDFKGGYMATKYLIDRGHKNIVFASPEIRENGVIYQRFQGYKEALTESGIPYTSENVYQQGLNSEQGLELGRKLAERKDVTAIFATADMLAIGIISGLREKGVSIPDDISVIGFDDIEWGKLSYPPLTTVHQNIIEKGKVAVDMLVDNIEQKDVQKHAILDLSITERLSVKKIKEN